METILFINPPLALAERYGSLAAAGAENCPHAFLYLGAVMKRHGYDVRILDASARMMTVGDVLEYIDNVRPDYIGITASTISIDRTASLSAMIRGRFPKVKIIIGGPHISAVPAETFNLYEVFEYALVGEAEGSLPALLKALKNGGCLDAVPGLCYRSGGNVVLNPVSKDYFDMTGIGLLAWDMLEGFPDRYSAASTYFSKTPYTDIITSRGCPFRCAFCDRSVFGNRVRSMGIDNIIRNLEHLIRNYGIKSVYFQDDTLLVLKDTFKELCDYLIRRKYDFVWSCNSRIDQINEVNLEMMKKAGCWQISFGIESGSERILQSMNKKIVPAQVIEKLGLVRKYGIKANGYFILGTPFETTETIAETVAFCRRIPLNTIRVSYFTPFPGSEMSDECGRYGSIRAHWSKFTFYNVVYLPENLTEDDLVTSYKTIMRNFYLRPETLISFVAMIKSPKTFFKIGKGFYGFLKLLASKS
ncbi:MAG: B12-binding domain-containing radical SAM protein [Nitrospirae bacterium]|nr:B12-binding domain-containing radical SAM protein [Nitrospirota bacterium]